MIFLLLRNEDQISSHSPYSIVKPIYKGTSDHRGKPTIFSEGYSKEQEFEVVMRMDGRLIKTRVYGRGTLEESRIECEKNNGTLPWRTFKVEAVDARGIGSADISYIKSRLFWMNTTIEHPVNITSLSEKIGGPDSSKLKELEDQIAGLFLENMNKTYCALR